VLEQPEFDEIALLAALVAGGVDFVVVGGFAGVIHGITRVTQDLDIAYADDQANLDRLSAVLVELEGKLRGVVDDVPFVPDGRALRRLRLATLLTAHGSLDLLAEPAGAPPYPELRARAPSVTLAEGLDVRVASLDDLLAMKYAAGRPKDLMDAAELEALKRLAADDAQRRG
jgi:hypothetical protein